jgi:hypothetical protein
VRLKIEDVEVENPKEAMRKFKVALAQVVKAPKVATRSNPVKAKPKTKRKG